MTTNTRATKPEIDAAMTVKLDAYRKRLEAARVGDKPRYDEKVIERKVELEKQRLASKDQHARRFQRVYVPNDGGGYDTRYRCRTCGEDVEGPDPSRHECKREGT